VHQLDRDIAPEAEVAFELQVTSLPDLAHAAGAEAPVQPVPVGQHRPRLHHRGHHLNRESRQFAHAGPVRRRPLPRRNRPADVTLCKKDKSAKAGR
jgi:hypothetical protein